MVDGGLVELVAEVSEVQEGMVGGGFSRLEVLSSRARGVRVGPSR